MIELYIALAALAGSTLGFFAASLLISHRNRRLYTRGWNAGRDFANRQFHDTIQDFTLPRRKPFP